MRKIITSILAIALILTSFSMVSFATTYNIIYLGDGSGSYTADSDTATLDLYFDIEDEVLAAWGVCALEFTYDVIGANVNPSINSTLDSALGTSKITYEFSNTINKFVLAVNPTEEGKGVLPDGAIKLGTFVVTRLNDAATTTISFANMDATDTDGDSYGMKAENLTITWPSSTPEASAEIDSASDEKGTTIDAGNDLTYINVPNYVGKVSVSNLGDKKVVVTPVIKVNGETKTDLKSAPPITFDENSSFDNGKVVFKFALIGAPEDLINSITIEATAEITN